MVPENNSAVPPSGGSPAPLGNPSHTLYVELATRITTQRLHYRSGDEETAAKSIHSLFQVTRDLMTRHPDSPEFLRIAEILLNQILRPYTARWHGWMTQDGDKMDKEGRPILKLRDEWVRRKFREELRTLQPILLGVQQTFAARAKGGTPDPSLLNPPLDSPAYERLLQQVDTRPSFPHHPLPSRIRPQVPLNSADETGKSSANSSCGMLAAEHEHIRARRAAMGNSNDASGLKDAFGLALSGGGIRSATFCLGVVQALHRRGLFRQVDYLSTVSGGGYLGTFLTSYLGHGNSSAHPRERLSEVLGKTLEEEQAELENSGNDRPDGNAEPPPLRHLRNNSKYLLNGGLLAVLRIASVFLNGLFAAFLILLTLPLLLAWFVKGVKWLGPSVPDWLFQWSLDLLPQGIQSLSIFHRPGGGLLAFLLILTVVFIACRPIFQRLAEGEPWTSGLVTIRQFIENTGNFVAVAAILCMALCGSYLLVETYDVMRESLKIRAGQVRLPDWAWGLLSAVIPTVLGFLAKRRSGGQRKWAKWLFLLSGPLFFLVTFTIIASHLGVGTRESDVRSWAIVTCILLAWVYLALNVNTFAPHRYYRDRLCECYLAVPEPTQIGIVKRGVDSLLHGACPDRSLSATKVGTLRSSPLSEAGRSPATPYHLINAVLNAPASHNPELRGRNGDFFLFSPRFCGSPLTGYLTTEQMEEANPGLDLGTAMAISGAAASTNMGSQTRRDVRFLLTLFNVRLGYWMRRPGLKPLPPLVSGPGPLYFIREMIGALHERTRYINLSDGGHIENLAVYELLRRQCKFIVCVDAGMEPGMECADLMRLQRLAEIDFGIRMHFDLTDLTPLPTQYSRAYGVLAKIDYAPERAVEGRETSDQLGWMLYLKLAVTGTEPRHILDYRRQNPAFPHQTTSDQFYDEAQFESYRALGNCAAASLFREEIIGRNRARNELEVKDWFELLAASLLQDNDEAVAIARGD